MGCKRESNNPWRQNLLLLLILQISAANGPSSNVQGEKMHSSKTANGLVVGSRPPICDHKCGGCVPCAAIQVPTDADGLDAHKYSNYEPERWKCKCESSFFDP